MDRHPVQRAGGPAVQAADLLAAQVGPEWWDGCFPAGGTVGCAFLAGGKEGGKEGGSKEGDKEASPWYTHGKKAVEDCKRRWPNVAKTHPDYATTKMTNDLVQLLQGKDPRSIHGCSRKSMISLRDNTKWKLEWKKPGA